MGRKIGSILVASSEEETKREVGAFLLERGHRVKVVERGSEAILALFDEEPDLIVIDLELIEIPGLKTIELVKRLRPRVPLIVLSGDASVETGGQVLEKGVFSYFIKPLDLPFFGEMIDCALERTKRQAFAKGGAGSL